MVLPLGPWECRICNNSILLTGSFKLACCRVWIASFPAKTRKMNQIRLGYDLASYTASQHVNILCRHTNSMESRSNQNCLQFSTKRASELLSKYQSVYSSMFVNRLCIIKRAPRGFAKPLPTLPCKGLHPRLACNSDPGGFRDLSVSNSVFLSRFYLLLHWLLTPGLWQHVSSAATTPVGGGFGLHTSNSSSPLLA
jgi:hypothetical protein